MGAWGTALFSDDFACDIRDEYVKYIIKGKTSEGATEILRTTMMPEESDEEYPLFWIALAVAQWKKGRLLPDVKERAVALIESGKDLERWTQEPRLLEKRRMILEKAKQMLLSSMPPAKKIPTPAWMKSDPWQTGDILSYKIVNDALEHSEYMDKYVLLRVVDMQFYAINETYLAEYSVFAWCGADIPDPEITTQLSYIILEEKNSRHPDHYCICEHIVFNSRDIKERDIRLLMNDPAFRIEDDKMLKSGRSTNSYGSPYVFDHMATRGLHALGIKPL